MSERLQTFVLEMVSEVLDNSVDTCRYHGTDFEKLGTEPWSRVGLPRCDSCKQPWRVRRARAAIERLAGS